MSSSGVCETNNITITNVQNPANIVNLCLDENAPVTPVTTIGGAAPALIIEGFQTYQNTLDQVNNDISSRDTAVIVLSVFLAIFIVLFAIFLSFYILQQRIVIGLTPTGTAAR